MAKKKKKKGGGPPKDGWLVTFSDLVTLLLTFFVLLLSMSSLDKSVIKDMVSVFQQGTGFLGASSRVKVEDRFKIVRDILQKPWQIYEKKQRIIDLLFPDEALSPDLSKSTLAKNLEILRRPEGVAIVLNNGILFASGQYKLKPEVKPVLNQLAQLIAIWPAPVNIAGYTDNTRGRKMDNYTLSSLRALSVLEYFREQHIEAKRFSVSAYGPNFPIASNKTPEGRKRNRRVEILFKLTGYHYL
ncbi:MAG: flagellar motor protein MotB [Desulfonauticus sp.]|nr:flagellar motor protein MotB [Desulfonauticus sp.]